MRSANLTHFTRSPWSLLIGLCLALAAGGALATCKYDSIPATAPASRFTNNGDGTVTDKGTGLQWRRCAEGQSGADCTGGSAIAYHWQGALQRADAYSSAGWRLPNPKELASIVERACYAPSIDQGVFPNSPWDFWSSSPYALNVDYAWMVDFAYSGGSVYANAIGKDRVYYVRLVRGRQ